ncbi:MAG: HD domain-containing phosphohydrolase [Dehalococcoidia bacterium]
MSEEAVQVLLVEDNADDVAIIGRMLAAFKYSELKMQHATSTKECVQRLRRNGIDLLLLDYGLPGEDGLTFLRRLTARHDAPPVIILTGQGDERIAVEAIREGAFDYFPKSAVSPQLLGEAIYRAVRRFREEEDLRRYDEQIVFALAATAERKDSTSGGHLRRIAYYAVRVGQELGLDDRDLTLLRYGALLHDIGKLMVDQAMLRKPGKLTSDEWDEIRQHPIVGERMCAPLTLGREIGPIVRHHHERWDGGGYVDALKGDAIPFLARIISVADAYDAMSTDRPYRLALPPTEVKSRLSQGAGTQWDPRIVRVFLDSLDARGGRA